MYAHLRDHRHWVLPEVIAAQAISRGDHPLVTTVDGQSLTYAACAAEADQVASFCAGLGVAAGDRVVVLLPNGLDFIRVWCGLGRLGATIVPLNTALTGEFLAHQVRDCGAETVIADADGATALAGLRDVPAVRTLVAVGETGRPDGLGDHIEMVALEGWRGHAAYEGPMPAFSDIACVMYTSGTTGPSKGVLMPHAHCYLYGLGMVDNLGITPEDRYYVTMPLFHANGLFMQCYGALIAGASIVLRERFSASAWLDDIRRHECTVTNLLGAMTQFVMNQPVRPDDAAHTLRVVCPVPNPPQHEAGWRERFGVSEVVSGYGMTENNIPLHGRLGQPRPGSCGRVYEGYFEVEIRDPDTDEPLGPGEVGEIMARPKVPFGFMAGYLGLPDKTLESWRNFWFHTGDSGYVDEEGWFTFVDRTKDCIRRRGENVSSFEVELAVARMPGLAEVAAYAVPAGQEGTEDEVMLACIAEPGAGVSAADVAAYADAVLPRFAQPRYVEMVEEIPKTPTAKVQKQRLRTRGVTAATWDRQA
ncbi:AMP-binding protein [Actinomycetota bacterium]